MDLRREQHAWDTEAAHLSVRRHRLRPIAVDPAHPAQARLEAQTAADRRWLAPLLLGAALLLVAFAGMTPT